jgi:uncharacterized membrane protein
MAAHAPEIAAATLEHAERIRLLTDRVDKQRRSIVRLGSAVGVLIALQVLALLPVAMEGTAIQWVPFMSRGLARGFLIGGLTSMLFGLLFRRRIRAA